MASVDKKAALRDLGTSMKQFGVAYLLGSVIVLLWVVPVKLTWYGIQYLWNVL